MARDLDERAVGSRGAWAMGSAAVVAGALATPVVGVLLGTAGWLAVDERSAGSSEGRLPPSGQCRWWVVCSPRHDVPGGEEHEMASQKQAALNKARERRVALDRNRAARDNRVEQAAAKVFVLIEQHHAAEAAMQEASTGVGKALRELLEEGITVDGVAELCELEVAEVRRLVRTPTPAAAQAASVTQLRPLGPTGEGGAADGAAAAVEGEVASAERRAE